MRWERWVEGELAQCKTPDWGPLMAVLDEPLLGWFMWMHEVRTSTGVAIHAYKHSSTRRYLHLDEYGTAYLFYELGYLEVDLDWAIEKVFASWLASGRATAEDASAVWTAIERARAAG
jgi:hypothetical protein